MQKIFPVISSQFQSSIDDEDIEIEDEDDEDFLPPGRANESVMGYSARRSKRGKKIKPKKDGRLDEHKPKSDGDQQQINCRRLRQYESEKSMNPSADMVKIGRYLMAMKNARTNAIYRLVQQKKANEADYEWMKEAERTESQWEKVEEISPSLTRWLGTESIELLFRTTLPSDFKGFSAIVNKEKIIASKLIAMPKKKRGRPRKSDAVEETKSQSKSKDDKSTTPKIRGRGRPPKPLVTFGKPITLNEHLHSLVDASIAQQRTPQQPTAGGRHTNNSLNVSFDMSQASISTPNSTTSLPRSSSINSMPKLKKPKLEPSDFELPTNFCSANTPSTSSSSFPIPSTSTSTEQLLCVPKLRWADRPFTSTSNPSTEQSQTNQKKAITNNGINGTHQPLKKDNRTGQIQTGRGTNNNEENAKRQNGIESQKDTDIFNEEEQDESRRIKLPIFTSRTIPFEIDSSTALPKCFESLQIIDIYNVVPQPIDPRLKNEGDSSAPAFVLGSTDRYSIRQKKQSHHTAQLLFCGGPLSAIAVCPRAMQGGREMIAIATFADETMGGADAETDSFIQLWINHSSAESSQSSASLGCLLHVPDARQVCSMAWCPQIDDDFYHYKTPLAESSANKPSNQTSCSSAEGVPPNSPLGLLTASTFTGKIHIYRIPFEFDALLDKYKTDKSRSTAEIPLVLETTPLVTLCHPNERISHLLKIEGNSSTLDQDERNLPRKKRNVNAAPNNEQTPTNDEINTIASIPLFGLHWNPFLGAKYLAAVSAYGYVCIWDLTRPAQLAWKIHFDDWQSPPQSVCWLEHDKVCISFRHRLIRIYRLHPPKESDQLGSAVPLMECDINRTCGPQCYSQPLLFPGLINYDTTSFINFGRPQQAPSYLWQKTESGEEEMCVTTLSNCHQIRNNHVSVCARTGLCATVGADGRLVCSLNGRMAPRELKAPYQSPIESETFMHGRTLLQLITHDKKTANTPENDKKFCLSHMDCCTNKWLEIRVGDCALTDQENERISRRRVPEVCVDRRIESLTVTDFSHRNPGLIYCGGDSGLVFIVPCSL